MGCGAINESPNEPPNEDEEKDEANDSKDKEESQKQEKYKNSKKKNESFNFDEVTINHFNHFNEEEISLILERAKSVNLDSNFSFLFSKFEVDYSDKDLNKTNTVICKEYLVCYVNPSYTGNFGYESQAIGFCPKSVKLDYCAIKDKKKFAQMKNNGKIISVLQIEEGDKDENYKHIMVFEFVYKIIQIKMYGMRVIDIFYDEKPMSCSISIRYDKNIFNIISNDDSAEITNNSLYLFDSNKFCLTLIDKNNVISIKKDESKISKLVYEKFSPDEIKQINNTLKSMNIKPLEKNLIYEKMIHNLNENKDYVKGFLLIFQPSFDKNYFDLNEGIDMAPDSVDFLITQLKINDILLTNLKELGEKQDKPDNYYESSNTSHHYNIRTNDDFILFEFELEGIESKNNKNEIEYNLDAKKIFNFFLELETSYKFEIILNNHEVYFDNEKKYNYKYEKTKDKIKFEGVWKLKTWNNKESKKILPNEFVIKKN